MADLLRKYLNHYAQLGTSSLYDGAENVKIRLMNFGYLFCIIGCFISFALRFIYQYDPLLQLRPLTMALIFCAMPVFSYFKNHRIGWHLGGVIILSGITLAAFQQPILYVNYLIYGTVTFLIIYLYDNDKKVQYLYLGYIALNIIAFTYFSAVNSNAATIFPFGISLVIIFITLIAQFAIISTSFNYKLIKEKELAYAISLKNAALDANKDATIILSLDGKVTGYNKRYLTMWGITEEDIKENGEDWLLKNCLSRTINKEEIINTLIKLKKSPTLNSFDIIYFKDGRILESHTQPQKIGEKILGRVYNYRDVTEKYQSAKRLAESESRFRSFFEDCPIGVIILKDKYLPFENVNQQICKMFGYTAEEMSKLTIEDISDKSYAQQHNLDLKAQLSTGRNNVNVLNKYLRKSGESFWGKLSMSFERDESGKIISVIGMVQDINEQKLQEEKIKNLIVELKLLNEKLEQKVKMRTVDLRQSNNELRRSNQDLEQFAYIASHDLQEPLRMVGNFVQLLERQYHHKIDDEGREYIKYIVDGVNRMSKLIQNLLKYSRVGRKESELRTVKLDRIIEAKLFGLRQKITDTQAEISLAPIAKDIFCEPDQLGMVFYNLISNALKFNTTQPKIEIGYEENEKQIKFFVKDNGIGIEKRYENKVFEIFKRLHRREEYEGTGIGLALCKKIISRHGGEIWFESEPNTGTTFYFTISKSLKNEKYVPLDSNLVG